MISVEETTDRALVKRIVTDPRVYRAGSVHDEAPARESWQTPIGFTFLLAKHDADPIGVILMESVSEETWYTHLAFLPEGWGPGCAEACPKAIAWMREHTKCKYILASIPEFNRLAQALARRVGFEFVWSQPEGYAKDGRRVAANLFAYKV